jgi:hypothetical protein
VLVSSPASPGRRVAGGWRETHEKQQFYSFGAAAGHPDPGRIGIAKTVAQFAATHLIGPYSQSRLALPSKTPARTNNVCVRADAAPAKRMICQNAAGLAIRPCAKFERKSF